MILLQKSPKRRVGPPAGCAPVPWSSPLYAPAAINQSTRNAAKMGAARTTARKFRYKSFVTIERNLRSQVTERVIFTGEF